MSNPNIIVSFKPNSADYKVISTFSEDHRNSQNFYLCTRKFMQWLECSDPWSAQYLEMDMHNVFKATHSLNGKVEITIYWVRVDNSEDIRGYMQSFSVDAAKLRDIMIDTHDRKILASTKRDYAQAKINISKKAHSQIRVLILNKQMRRALSKALSTNFFYGSDDVVDLYTSWGSDFDFSCDGINGGLVLHDAYVIGYDGKHHQKLFYSVHT